LGADGHDFEPVVQMLKISNTRFILPHAPHRPITANNGYEMPGWYDIIAFGGNNQEDEVGIRATQQQIEGLIAQEVARGIPSKKIALLGFSQGGAIALQTGLRHTEPLAGILALSTYLALESSLSTEASPANKPIPIFMAHGTVDNVIPMSRAERSLNALKSNGYHVNWHEYTMAHTVSMEEISDIRDFLTKILR
jgi:phospholipase/carboxylesterase